MPNCCSVCMNNSNRNKNISFFKYPNDLRRNIWLKIVNREDLISKATEKGKLNSYRVCEMHFEKKYIVHSRNGKSKFLSKNSVPTLNLPLSFKQSSSLAAIEDAKEGASEDVTVVSQPPAAEDITTQQSSIATKRKLPQEPLETKHSKTCDLKDVTKKYFLTLCDMFLDEDTCQLVKRKMKFDSCVYEDSVPSQPTNTSIHNHSHDEQLGFYTQSSNPMQYSVEMPQVSSESADQSYYEDLCKIEAIDAEDPQNHFEDPLNLNSDSDTIKAIDAAGKTEHSVDGFLAGIRSILQRLSPFDLGLAKMEIIETMFKYSEDSNEPIAKTPDTLVEKQSTNNNLKIQMKIEPPDDYT